MMILIAAVIGFFIGSVGIGGVLLVAFLHQFSALEIHVAAATSLFSFLFCGALGTALFCRHGSVSLRISIPIAAGGLLFSFIGARIGALVASNVLNAIVALIIIASGASVLLLRSKGNKRERRPPDVKPWALFWIGAVCGFGSGLSGAGGSVFLVPIMLIVGFAPLPAIGSSQVFLIASALSGSAGNAFNGFIDFRLASLVALPLLVGVMVGGHFAHKVAVEHLKSMAAGLCLLVGALMLWR
jgi:uncharacterized protein